MPDICDFPGSQIVGKPKDWVDELDGECMAIYIASNIDERTGMREMHTMYQFTPEEIEALAAGGSMRLTICGNFHPVFKMAVFGPNLTGQLDLVRKSNLGGVLEV